MKNVCRRKTCLLAKKSVLERHDVDEKYVGDNNNNLFRCYNIYDVGKYV